jgi:hypothetical protein
MIMQKPGIRCRYFRRSMSLLAAVLLPATAFAASEMTVVNADDLKWGDAPPSLPKGAKIAVLYGDPSKAGPFVLRLKAPAGYKIPPHWHSQAEALTVVSGTFYFGMGDKMDTNAAHLLKTGGFHYLSAKEHHFAFSKVASVVQLNGEGPFDITYINAVDDPQKSVKP